MSSTSYNNKRIAKNTLYLYLRTFFVMAVSIFTSRIVLDTLGIEDYGIYNVVGGFVSMFSVLSGTLTAASQRFIAYELGKRQSDVGKIFSTIITIHLLLSCIIFILLEIVGLWFLNYKMNISADRLEAANWVFHCSVITFCINLISIPYNAVIVAYEKMSAFAYISIFEVVAKLLIVYTLYFIAFDSLIIYSVFMLIVAVLLRILYGYYCTMHFKDCQYILSFDKSLFREILKFSGWNFIGSTSGILNNQGINVLINLFFGVTLNAARGIAMQVDNAINTFVQNFMMALNPQITKKYAAGDYEYVNKIIITGTKFAFFLFWIICLPVYLNTEFVLSLWLKQVPNYAVLFVRLGIIYTLCQNLSQCLYITMLATGHIKKYQIIVGTLSLMSFPTAWIFFKCGLPVEYGYWSIIIFSVACLIARLYLLQEMVSNFNIQTFVKRVIIPIVLAIVPAIVVAYYIHNIAETIEWESFIVESFACVIISLLSISFLGINYEERNKIKSLIKSKFKKLL